MKRVLLLGGTGDALAIARRLGREHVYSLAGLGRVPGELECAVRVGGYGGVPGLAAFIGAQGIALVIDATHPYAAQMSRHAADACAQTGVPCWAIRRAAWQPQAGDDWRDAPDWRGMVDRIAPYRRPLWTLGREPLAHLDDIPLSQHWTIRCLDPHPGNERATIIDARGPFSPQGERALFAARGIDVLVSKNSGGRATEAKLAVARELRLPVVMLRRPPLPAAAREFDDTASALQALEDWLQPEQSLLNDTV
ncbi:Cobalt-precorrin-6x reductase [Caballeronia glathei]|jgi:precorrin-6A/cobalt-precorrin-6A reductase|uniref:Cobalt-precorrin-6X reductase n=1 Tax=Caballeronia glathei TaxID=60547 RepID=A0A069PUD0_9BURK|nr:MULTISPECIES: cobalt-precorrin-6A reductase [Burkholderiaceae]KDR43449.1 cobalt-precorrin-6X reductase [Caballeronia glathei]TCK39027.1 precorrin-6A reductase [Paraburkholderia sp. BL8N3]CDY76267.1 Cobalt-precorrin-6x reductase [Caballeronia glathei]